MQLECGYVTAFGNMERSLEICKSCPKSVIFVRNLWLSLLLISGAKAGWFVPFERPQGVARSEKDCEHGAYRSVCLRLIVASTTCPNPLKRIRQYALREHAHTRALTSSVPGLFQYCMRLALERIRQSIPSEGAHAHASSHALACVRADTHTSVPLIVPEVLEETHMK